MSMWINKSFISIQWWRQNHKSIVSEEEKIIKILNEKMREIKLSESSQLLCM